MGERNRSQHDDSNRFTGKALKKLEGLPAPFREQIMDLAGLTPSRLAKLVRGAAEALTEALQATKAQRLVVPGAKCEAATVQEWHDIDHIVRLKASDQAMALAGMYPPRSGPGASTSAPGQPVTVNIVMRDMAPHMQALPPVATDVPDNVGTIIDVEPEASNQRAT